MKTLTQKKKKTPTRGSFLLEERVYSPPGRVDRENGVIHGVKILGTRSENAVPSDLTGGKRVQGYSYNKSARTAMAQLCEGMGVNIDHPSRKEPLASRSVRDRFGKLVAIKETADGIYGDLHYLKSHPMAEQVCEMAERMPEVFGLSPVAFTDVAYTKNGYVVEGVQRVRSVDVVQKPATNVSLFEDEDESMAATLTFKEVLKEQPKILALLEELEPGMSDMPVEGGEAGMGSDAAIKSAFRTAILATFDDESYDMKATISRIKDIVKSYYKLMDEPVEEETDPVPEETTEPTVEDLKEELAVRDMLWNAGITPTKAKVKSLILLEEKEEREELIAAFKTEKNGKTETPKKRVRSGFAMEDVEDVDRTDRKTRSFADCVKSSRGGMRVPTAD
jgi:hypothetical protein